MGKNKLKKFAEMNSFEHVVQPTREDLNQFELKNNWASQLFGNSNPIVLELGCGRGEYALAMAERFPEKNFIGIDIKGSRMWQGATQGFKKGLKNLAFLRISIEHIVDCFGENEVDEIWITFPDPQIKFRRRTRRLTHPDFLAKYNQICKPDAVLHLKTDSAFLYGYTVATLEHLDYQIIDTSHDVYNARKDNALLMEVKTYYEDLFHKKGYPITYIQFKQPAQNSQSNT
ncbi:MAG: tRNA (guanosine(46)-N7)-methyltransferase TrmB [Flavobacteriales bacterium]